ncbi:MAG: PASTA domain-containing protein [Nannocystaceae bacterium]
MANDPLQYLDALSAPVGDLITSVGLGVARAQAELDSATVAALKEIYENVDDQTHALLREIGYRPTFYAIPEATGEIAVALTISGQAQTSSTSGGAPVPGSSSATRPRARMYAAPVDASYRNRYGYELQASSQLKFKIVPVPPSNQAEQLRVIPDLIGKSFADTTALLDLFTLSWEIDGGGEPADADLVQSHVPAPGSLVPAGTAVTLTMAP